MVGVREFEQDGYWLAQKAVSCADCEMLGNEFRNFKAGQRFFRRVGPLAIDRIFKDFRDTIFGLVGEEVRPVRMIYFDKTADSNWSLGWHQDRTIAVRDAADVDDFGPWTKKAGVTHVEPPFRILEKSITARLSIDPSSLENGALEVLSGTHRLGKLTDRQTLARAESQNAKLLETGCGDVLYLSTPILHRSGQNKSASRRRTIQIDFSWADLPTPLEWAFDL